MPQGLRERQKQRRRDAIIDAAVALFRERGYLSTTVEDILEAAEVSLGTLYNYFPGKDAILDAFGARLIADYVGIARVELEATEQPVAERLRVLAGACGRAFSSDPEFMAVVAARSRSFGGGGSLPEGDEGMYELLSALIEEGQGTGEIRADLPPIELAQIFSGIFMFTVVSWLAEGAPAGDAGSHEEALDGRLARALDIFISGARA